MKFCTLHQNKCLFSAPLISVQTSVVPQAKNINILKHKKTIQGIDMSGHSLKSQKSWEILLEPRRLADSSRPSDTVRDQPLKAFMTAKKNAGLSMQSKGPQLKGGSKINMKICIHLKETIRNIFLMAAIYHGHLL